MGQIDKKWLVNFAELVGENLGEFRKNVSGLLAETANALEEKVRALDERARNSSPVFGKNPQPNGKETIAAKQKTCIGNRCQSPAAPDNLYCYEHFFEREAFLRSANLRKNQAQNVPPTTIFTCNRTNCTKQRSPDSDLCSQHLIEFGMYKQRQCGKKKRHRTHEEAQDHLRGLAYVERKHLEAFTIYSCEFCNTYHVGHKK